MADAKVWQGRVRQVLAERVDEDVMRIMGLYTVNELGEWCHDDRVLSQTEVDRARAAIRTVVDRLRARAESDLEGYEPPEGYGTSGHLPRVGQVWAHNKDGVEVRVAEALGDDEFRLVSTSQDVRANRVRSSDSIRNHYHFVAEGDGDGGVEGVEDDDEAAEDLVEGLSVEQVDFDPSALRGDVFGSEDL